MPNRSSKKKKLDVHQLAARIVEAATGVPILPEPEQRQEAPTGNSGKLPAAVELGRRGGKKGGPARAKKLSKRRLSEIAKKAANTRWSRRK